MPTSKRKRRGHDYKRCRCCPDCYEILAQTTRKRHYRRPDLDLATVLPSDFGDSDIDHATDVASLESSPEIGSESDSGEIGTPYFTLLRSNLLTFCM